MNRFFRRATSLAALGAAALLTTAASATDFLFYNANASATAGNALTYSSKDGSGLTLAAYGGHMANNSGGMATTTGATVATWTNYGMGVLSGTDNAKDGSHQIDNMGGVDYVALVFNQAVTLSDLAVKAYGGSGVGTGVDAQFRTYGGTVADLVSGNNQLWQGYFASPAGSTTGNGGYVIDSTGATITSKIWLVAANVTQSNDAFKLLGVTVRAAPTAAVPEPASWAMMLMGFGAVGAGLRRRRSTAAAIA